MDIKALCVCPADTDGYFVSRIFLEPPAPIPRKAWFFLGGDGFFQPTTPASEKKINKNIRIIRELQPHVVGL